MQTMTEVEKRTVGDHPDLERVFDELVAGLTNEDRDEDDEFISNTIVSALSIRPYGYGFAGSGAEYWYVTLDLAYYNTLVVFRSGYVELTVSNGMCRADAEFFCDELVEELVEVTCYQECEETLIF